MTKVINTTSEARAAHIAGQTLTVITPLSILATLLYSYVAWQRDVWQMYALVILVAGLAGICYYCLLEVKKGRHRRAMILFLSALMLLGVAASALISNIGLLVGFLLVVLVLQISSQTLPAQTGFYMLLASFGTAVITAALHALSPSFQHMEPLALPFTAVAAAAVILIYGVGLIRDYSSLPLRTKLTISFLSISFVSIISIALVSGYYARTTQIQNANETLLSQATETGRLIDQFLVDTRNVLRAEAQVDSIVRFAEMSPEERLDSSEEAQTNAILAVASRRDPINILSYALLDREGNNIADTFPAQVGTNEAHERYFQEAVTRGDAVISDMRVTGTGGQSQIYFSAPVRDNTGMIVGVLRIRYNAAAIHRIVNSTVGLAGPSSFAVLVDENNIYLSHSVASDQQFRSIRPLTVDEVRDLQTAQRLPLLPPEQLSLNLPELDEQLRQTAVTPIFTAADIATEEGVNQAVAVTMNTKPWQVVFFQPQAIFLEPVERLITAIALVVIAVTAVVTVVAVLIAQRLAAPIVRLTEAAQQISAGNLDTRAEVSADDEIGLLATAFNDMVTQLRELIGSLEQRVAERTRALEASAEVSRRLSTILEQAQLIDEVVTEIQVAFDYYHVHIYLYDEERRHLVMAGGTGEAAQAMLAHKHRIEPGRGLVGRAGASNQIILVPDVRQDENWLPNPLLPETRAEIAVPISVGATVLGVLDVQHNVREGLSDQDSSLLQSVANQVAVALNNARLYEQAQRAAQREALINRINQQIQRATTVEDVLQIATQELGETLRVEKASVYLQSHGSSGNGRQ
jgi:putative methionine-R-sulfoxide reductase with GAF domain